MFFVKEKKERKIDRYKRGDRMNQVGCEMMMMMNYEKKEVCVHILKDVNMGKRLKRRRRRRKEKTTNWTFWQTKQLTAKKRIKIKSKFQLNKSKIKIYFYDRFDETKN